MQNDTHATERIQIGPAGDVLLRLRGVSRRRRIGRIECRTLYVDRDPVRHYHRLSHSFGFNYELMKHGAFDKVVVRVFGRSDLETTRQTILDYGHFLYFKKAGCERQIFLTIPDFGKMPKLPLLCVLEKSPLPAGPRRVNQLDLFSRQEEA